jgi:hypothetical protein
MKYYTRDYTGRVNYSLIYGVIFFMPEIRLNKIYKFCVFLTEGRLYLYDKDQLDKAHCFGINVVEN